MKTKLFLLFIIVCQSVVYSQQKLADKFFDIYAYTKAAEFYKQAIDKGDNSLHVLSRLGDCYYNNSDSENAEQWYRKAIDLYKNEIAPNYIFKYIHTLRSAGKLEEANKWVDYINTNFTDSNLDISSLSADAYQDLLNTTENVQDIYTTVYSLPFNTEYTDFGGHIFNNTFLFSSSRPNNAERNKDKNKKAYLWNDEPYLEIFQSDISIQNDSINIDNISLLNSEVVNTQGHESSSVITNDGNTMYFTRNNMSKKNKKLYDKKGTSHLKIYRATKSNNQWVNVEELSINDKAFSTGHPALSPDNKTLYFVSNRPGGFGQTDIYKATINADGALGPAENLGDKINTNGREMFPFVAKDSTLYFSSDSHVNLGLLDIFKTNILKTNNNITIENLGAPYNSGFDDFAFFANDNLKSGIFSSNRPGGKGKDDVYAFRVFKCQQQLKGTVYDSLTKAPIPNATVELINAQGKVIESKIADVNGVYEFILECNKNYTVVGSKADYERDIKTFNTDKESYKDHIIDLHLKPLIIGDEIVINPIFFDFDKWDIRTDAAYELERIVSVMQANPKMVIKIEAHTDSRGRDAYNLKLSDKRAKSTRDYILSRGIAKQRIESAVGYGESQLLNKCKNGVKCSEDEHQQNRRSKFIIIDDLN